jgi:hypothetical protein
MREKSSVILYTVGLIACGLSAVAYAEPTAPSRRVVAMICITPPCGSAVTDGSPMSLNGTLTAEDGSTLTSSISAASTFDELSAVVAAGLNRLTPGITFAFVSVKTTDVLTIDSPPLTGTADFISLNYKMNGSIGESGIVIKLAARAAAEMKPGGLRTSGSAFESPLVQSTARPISARLGQEFDVRIGETAAIGDEPLTVVFEQVVEDSRCPANTTCVWAGTAVVRLGLRVGDTARGTVNLQTLPEVGAEGVFQKYRLRLVRLAPTPRDSSRIPVEQYVLTLIVSRLE